MRSVVDRHEPTYLPRADRFPENDCPVRVLACVLYLPTEAFDSSAQKEVSPSYAAT